MPRKKRNNNCGSFNSATKVLNLHEKRAERRPINAVMLARIALFPPIRKRTPNTSITAWLKKYEYAHNDNEKQTTIFVENTKALTFVHKRVFDSLLLSALQVFERNGKTEIRINPYKLKKIAGLPTQTNNAYLFKLIEELQSLKVKVHIYYPETKKTRKMSFVPVTLVDTDPDENKKVINPYDKQELFEITLQEKFVIFLKTKAVYSLNPEVLQQMHENIKNPYLDYAFKYLLTQSKKQKFELFILLEKLIFQEDISVNVKKKIKKDILISKEKHSELLEKLGISISQDGGKIYLSYTPTPAVILFFPHRSHHFDKKNSKES